MRFVALIYTVPKAAHISEKYLGVYMGASPLAGKFLKAVYPFSLQKVPKAFNSTVLPSEISEKSREEKKVISARFNPLPS